MKKFYFFRHANSAFVVVGLPQPVACGVLLRLPAELAFRGILHRHKTKHYADTKCHLCRAMMITQWSVALVLSNIIPGDRAGIPTRIKDISLKQFALHPLALVPSVSRKENFSPAPSNPLPDIALFAYTCGCVFFYPPLLNNGNPVHLMCCHNEVSWIKLNTPHVWLNSSNICVEFRCALFSKVV